ncbi:MAG: SprB repeat-containing protein, partial [Bacteroidota bacterium]
MLVSFGFNDLLFAHSSPNGFLINKGQIGNLEGLSNKDVQFLYANGPLHIQLRKTGFSYEIFESIQDSGLNSDKRQFQINRIDVDFVGLNPLAKWEGSSRFEEIYNYYNSRGRFEGVEGFRQVMFKDAWPGVDIVFKCNEANEVKYEIVAKNSASLESVKFRVNGAEQIQIENNSLIYRVDGKVLTDQFPRTYLNCAGAERTVSLLIQRLAVNEFGFSVNENVNCVVVVDPVPQLKWATYFGDAGSEHGYGVATDLNGDPYFVGSTTSSSNIATSGVYQQTYSSGDDAYLTKFLKNIDPTSKKSVRVWCTYFGDKSTDIGYAVAVDSLSQIYIAGESYYQSTSSILYRNKLQTGHNGKKDAFVAKFRSNGTLLWSNFYGGSEDDVARSIAVANNQRVVFVGQTASSLTHSASGSYSVYQSSSGSGTDGFVVQIDSGGNRQFSTYYGGSGTDIVNDVVVARDSIFIVGKTNSNNFSNNANSSFGNYDGFYSIFRTTGTFVKHLYLGGTSDEGANSIIAATNGSVYIAGTTNTQSWSLMTGHQTLLNSTSSSSSQTDAFVIKTNGKFNILWGSYYGGDLNEEGNGVTLDKYNNFYLGGSTESKKSIATTGAYQDTLKGGYDAFLVKFYPSGSRHWATYFGGNSNDYGQDITKGEYGDLFLVGRTSSTTNLILNAFQSSNMGSVDAYFANFSYCNKFLAARKDTVCFDANFTIKLSIDSSKFIKGYTGKINWNYTFPSSYKIKWTGPNSFSQTTQNVSRPYKNNTGTYTAIVINEEDCPDTISVVINYSHPKPYISVLTNDSVSCSGGCDGKVVLSMKGGKGGSGYPKFKKSTSSTWSTSGTFTGLCSGSHTFNLQDSNGCTADTTITISGPSALSVTTTNITNVDCKGNSTGSVTVSGSGGVAPYSFKLGSGSYVSTTTFSGLADGSYTITIKDAKGCLNSVTFNITEPAALVSSATGIVHVYCKGASTGSFAVSVSGGTSPYAYSINGSSYSSTSSFSSLSAGTYTIGVKDANGCTSSVSVTITEPSSSLSVSASSTTHVLCKGNSTGSVTVSGSGGTSPYTYNIGGGTYGASATFSSLLAGTYTIGVKDANGCTSSVSVSITEPSTVLGASTPTVSNVKCKSGSDGSINISGSGGTSPYTYYWTGPSGYTSTSQ